MIAGLMLHVAWAVGAGALLVSLVASPSGLGPPDEPVTPVSALEVAATAAAFGAVVVLFCVAIVAAFRRGRGSPAARAVSMAALAGVATFDLLVLVLAVRAGAEDLGGDLVWSTLTLAAAGGTGAGCLCLIVRAARRA